MGVGEAGGGSGKRPRREAPVNATASANATDSFLLPTPYPLLPNVLSRDLPRE
jgi:hypothetical protein